MYRLYNSSYYFLDKKISINNEIPNVFYMKLIINNK